MMPTCSYCHGTEFYEGPSGGMSTNILCANNACRHWFNWTAMLGKLDDLGRVEPTPDEKHAENKRRVIEADEQFRKRYQQGADAFAKGDFSLMLRTDPPYGGYSECAHNIDRLCGFIDALAEAIRSKSEL